MKQHSHTLPHSLQVSHTKFTLKNKVMTSWNLFKDINILKKAKFVDLTGLNGFNEVHIE